MGGVGFQGATANRPPWYRRTLNGTVTRRQFFAAGVVVALVIVLLAAPQVSTTASEATGKNIVYLPGQTHMIPAFTPGTTAGGYRCGPGVRQVPWSSYAPPCQPVWHGNNGGATAPGVTGSTITLSYREAATSILPLLYSIIPQSVVGTNAEAIQTLQSYLNIFNRDFELYGRKVVLAPFQGQGNFINEDVGTGETQAKADAITVADSLHAFADMSLIDSSVVYTQKLQQEGVVAFGLYLQDLQWYEQNAPWQYTPGPNCSKTADAIGAIYGEQLKGRDAEFAGAELRNQPRKVGIFYTNTPTAKDCEQAIVNSLASYGVTPAATAALTFDISQLPDESANAIAEMKQAGVTTIICSSCDPVSPDYYFAAANAANYHPEWFFQSIFAGGTTTDEKFIRLLPSNQRTQLLTIGPAPTPQTDSEAVHAYGLGNTDPAASILPTYQFVYGSILQFFDALQLAGPNLTPANFEAAMHSIPPSIPYGELGGWNGTYGPYDPASTFQILRWNENESSVEDGKTGTYDVCDGGKEFPYNASIKLPDGPLTCESAADVPHSRGQQSLATGLRQAGTAPSAGSGGASTTTPVATSTTTTSTGAGS